MGSLVLMNTRFIFPLTITSGFIVRNKIYFLKYINKYKCSLKLDEL